MLEHSYFFCAACSVFILIVFAQKLFGKRIEKKKNKKKKEGKTPSAQPPGLPSRGLLSSPLARPSSPRPRTPSPLPVSLWRIWPTQQRPSPTLFSPTAGTQLSAVSFPRAAPSRI